MKLKKTAIVLSTIICLSGCVSQNEYDNLNSQVSSLQSEAENYKSVISDNENRITDLEKNIENLESEKDNLESEKIELNNKITELTNKIDELENGASRLLSDINNAFENKDYQTAVNKANELHKRFNGSDEDVKAQAIAAEAQAEIDRVEAEKKAEEERKAAEAAKSKRERVQSIMRLGGAVVDEINSAGGVSFYVYWRNESEKDIKYLTFSVTPYNAVGDVVSSSIGNKTLVNCKITGPLPKSSTIIKSRDLDSPFFYCSPIDTWEYIIYYNGIFDYSYMDYLNNYRYVEVDLSEADMYNAFQGSYFDCAWYNNTIETIKINRVEIEYMDGTKEVLEEDDVNLAMYK